MASETRRLKRIAVLAPAPATPVLSADSVYAKYVGGEHPAPWVRILCEALAQQQDVAVRVIVDSRAVRRTVNMQHNNVEMCFLRKHEPACLDPFHLYIPGLVRIRRALDSFQPDLVHGFGTESIYGVAAALSGHTCVVSIQGIMEKLAPFVSIHPAKLAIWRQLELFAIRRTDGIVAENEFAATWARQKMPDRHIATIPHACDPAFFGITPTFDRPRVLAIGMLGRAKGTDIVIEAMKQVTFPDASLGLIGMNCSTGDYEHQARTPGMANRFEFMGFLPQHAIMKEMRSARCVVLGSRMDTSPNVITEAHAAGLPVVATRVGGMPEMIEDGRDGYLVPVDDAVAMAQRLDKLLADPSLCAEMGANGREKVRKLNDPTRIAAAHMEFFHSLLK